MKHLDYSIDDIKINIKKNKKSMIRIFAVSILIGICFGIVCGLMYKQPVYTLDDTVVDFIDLKSIEKDEIYYYNAMNALKEKKLSLDSYVQYLGQVDLSMQGAMKIEEFQEKIIQFDDQYRIVWNEWWNSSVLGYGSKEIMEQFLEDQIITYDSKIEAADEMIEEAKNRSFTRSFVSITETAALDNILSAKKEKKTWELKRDLVIETDEKTKTNENIKMDDLLEQSSSDLNQLVREFNTVIEYLELNEQYDIIYNKYLMKQYITSVGIDEDLPLEKVMANSKNNAIIYAKSVAGLDNGKERFFAIVTFFALFGIVVSILWGGDLQLEKIEPYNISYETYKVLFIEYRRIS